MMNISLCVICAQHWENKNELFHTFLVTLLYSAIIDIFFSGFFRETRDNVNI